MTSGITVFERHLIGKGAFSWVLADPEQRRVYKLFKRSTHPDYFGEDPFDDDRNVATFRSELSAYTLVQAHSGLIAHTPIFYGNIPVAAVESTTGKDISEYFLLNCCLCLERIDGCARKLGEVMGEHEHLRDFCSALQAAGVRYIIDASVFLPEDTCAFKAIDFATNDAANDYDVSKALG